ncbi:6-bladed beta-propeller [bacterium]|nr:6-bladed beta-propeller [bacterium]
MKRILSCFVIITLLSGISCIKKSNQPVVVIKDGVEIVQNRRVPLYPEKTVQFIEDLKIGGENENGKIKLFQPRHIAVDKNGSIFVSDVSDKSIKVFDKNGKYLGTIGRKGSGPGEFQSIGVMRFLPNDNLIVMDWRMRRVSFFTISGKFLQSFQMKNNLSGIYLTTDSTITCRENIYSEEKKLYIKSFDLNGNEKLLWGQFKPEEFKMLRSGNTTFGINVPYLPCSIFTGDEKNGWLYHCLNSKYLIEVYNKKGDLFRKIERLYKPVPVTSAEKEEYVKSFEDNPNKVFVKMAREVKLPKVKTITEYMIVDEKGNLWVETMETKKKDDKEFYAYDIFNDKGFYTMKVWLSITPKVFAGGYMHSIVRDSSGIASVKRYRIIERDRK